MPTQYKLTYFNSRGTAEPIRFIFAFTQIPYKDDRLSSDSWVALRGRKDKFPWGTLPVLVVEEQVLAQSNAILRYLGKKFKLAGENDFEAAKCDEVVEALTDLKKKSFEAIAEEVPAKKAALIAHLKAETYPKYLSQWNNAVVKNNGYLVGKKFSYADFSIVCYIELFNENLGGDLLYKYPALKAHAKLVKSAKGIKEWVAKRPKTQF